MATLISLIDGTIPVAADFNANFSAINAEVRPAGTGGTGQSTYVTGDTLYASASNTLTRLAAGSTGLVLTMTAGVPAWGAGNAGSPGVMNLSGTNNAATPTSKYDLLASFVTLRNPATGSIRTVAPTTLTNDIAAATTANGRDQAAAFSSSSWVYFYYVGTGSGSPITMSSASATGPTLLAGQTEWVLATAIFNNPTPRLEATAVRGANVFYTATHAALTTGASTSEATVSMTSFTPPIALRTRVQAAMTVIGGSTQTDTATMRFTSGTTANYFVMRMSSNVTGSDNTTELEMPNVSQQFLYQIVTGGTPPTLSVGVLGYTIANGDS